MMVASICLWTHTPRRKHHLTGPSEETPRRLWRAAVRQLVPPLKARRSVRRAALYLGRTTVCVVRRSAWSPSPSHQHRSFWLPNRAAQGANVRGVRFRTRLAISLCANLTPLPVHQRSAAGCPPDDVGCCHSVPPVPSIGFRPLVGYPTCGKLGGAMLG